jgi:hypothetical protein
VPVGSRVISRPATGSSYGIFRGRVACSDASPTTGYPTRQVGRGSMHAWLRPLALDDRDAPSSLVPAPVGTVETAVHKDLSLNRTCQLTPAVWRNVHNRHGAILRRAPQQEQGRTAHLPGAAYTVRPWYSRPGHGGHQVARVQIC